MKTCEPEILSRSQGSGPAPPLEQFLELVPLLVRPSCSVISVVRALAQKDSPFRYALVGDAQKIVGIFTATDALQWLAQAGREEGTTLEQVINTPVVSFPACDYRDPLTLLRWMQARGVEHLPIVDDQGSLLGVVNREELCLQLIPEPQPSQATALTGSQQALLALAQRLESEEEIVTEEPKKALNLSIGTEGSVSLSTAAVDLQGKQIGINDTFTKIVGWHKEDLVKRDPSFVYSPPQQLQNSFAAPTQGLDQQQPLQGWELAFMHRNGEHFPVRALRRDDEENWMGIVASVQDLSMEKESQDQQLEQFLGQQQALFQTIFDLSVNGLAIANASGQIVKVNDSFCQLTGYTRPELLGKNYEEITHAEDLPQEKIYVKEVLAGQRRSYRMEKRYIRKTGESVWVDCVSFTINIPGQGILGVASVIDISKQKQAQEQLNYRLQQTQLLNRITQGIRRFSQVKDILDFTVREIRHLLQVDRVFIYRFLSDSAGEILTESVSQPQFSLMDRLSSNPCCVSEWCDSCQQDQVSVIEDIQTAPIQEGYRNLLASLQVQSALVVPIRAVAGGDPVWQANSSVENSAFDNSAFTSETERFWGLLIAHHCTAPKSWDPWIPESLQQFAEQLSLALQQAVLVQQLQAVNAELHYQVNVRNTQLSQLLRYEKVLRFISDKVRSSLNEEDILTTIVQELTQFLQLGVCGVALLEPATCTYTLAYECADSIPGIGKVSLPLDPLLVQQLQQGRTLYFNTNHSLRGWCTIVACPLCTENSAESSIKNTAKNMTETQDQILSKASSQAQSKTTASSLSFLKLIRSPNEEFTPAEIRFVEQVATQCSIAIRQARLYQETQTQLQQLLQLSQIKEDFLNMVSHELRTPLTSMKMALKMLEVSGITETQARYFNILKQELQKELDLVNDLLDLQHLKSGNYPLKVASLCVQDWITELLEPFHLRFQERQLTFIPQIPPAPITFTTDVSLLTRILSELLNNAVKYTPTGEQIHLLVSTSPPHLHLRVTNTGVQIPSEHLSRIFEKFHRVPQLDQERQGGTGLGLPLVKKAVELLQGELYVESQENRTTFEVRLPNLSQ